MDSPASTAPEGRQGKVAIVGAGPSGLLLAIALARRGVHTTVFERDVHVAQAPRIDPDRSYTIDISGHGLKAIRHVDAGPWFDETMIPFKGQKIPGRATEEWPLPGWTGSRGDIQRALMALLEAKHRDRVSLEFHSRVTGVDVHSGTLVCQSLSRGETTPQFDLVVGGDGTGSLVRHALLEQAPGFTVETRSFPSYCTMIELDRVGDRLDRNYLHCLATSPFCVASAIQGDEGPRSSRWFCAVGTRTHATYASTEEARSFFRRRAPRVLELTSDEQVAAFARRTCYHIGQRLTCSQLRGGKAVLIGDAAAPFPPVGQGVNAAMESSMVLDLSVGEMGASPTGLLDAAKLYEARWKPEADAVSWISERSLFENPYHVIRARVASMLGISIFERARSVELPYSEVRRRAESLWPLWA
jgi:kynurenine 3-monooxygenase